MMAAMLTPPLCLYTVSFEAYFESIGRLSGWLLCGCALGRLGWLAGPTHRGARRHERDANPSCHRTPGTRREVKLDLPCSRVSEV